MQTVGLPRQEILNMFLNFYFCNDIFLLFYVSENSKLKKFNINMTVFLN